MKYSKQRDLVEEEVQVMLLKGAIQETNSSEGEFLSNIFLVPKKDGGQRPVINLKALNHFVPYEHFKMEDVTLSQGYFEARRLYVQNRFKGCIF